MKCPLIAGVWEEAGFSSLMQGESLSACLQKAAKDLAENYLSHVIMLLCSIWNMRNNIIWKAHLFSSGNVKTDCLVHVGELEGSSSFGHQVITNTGGQFGGKMAETKFGLCKNKC
ncbi:unnamed protein product [Cuscuta epithymum]|uniref:Uncharacterized protein n=1 Tax=Cuscuta epithymum TaxID=186058 RepID=A0AAV0C6G3_9ASTE|nr:unnamed protein product [Cuscuta epithymum]